MPRVCHPCYCFNWHIVLQTLGFRINYMLEVLRSEHTSSCVVLELEQSLHTKKELVWFIKGAVLCSNSMGTYRVFETGACYKLSSGFSFYQKYVDQFRCTVLKRTRKKKSFPFVCSQSPERKLSRYIQT